MQTIKPVSESNRRIYVQGKSSSRFSLYLPTLVILSVLGFLGAIAVSWLLGNSHVTELFIQLHLIQANPPSWLVPPQVSSQYHLLAPTVVLFIFAQIIIRLSPIPNTWSRRLVAMVLLTLFLRYFLWRSLSTLNLSTPAEGIFSLTLLFMELLAMVGGALQMLLQLTVKNRDREADRYSAAMKDSGYNPSVDILIPTYNEPNFILKRTIIGCQALDYDNKQVYILDDTRRQSVKQLAQELGCHYITRRNNSFAKAGNLNNALRQTDGELVVVFDADFVPTTNFLKRTVGFFQKEKVGLVQTPQSFYNADPIAYNFGLKNVLTAEEEFFYRHLQPMKDGAGSVVCAGTSFVARRKALQEVGYFATESVSEDYFTGIRISAKGYELVYLDEKLSAGLAAENIGSHIEQRMRWVRGTLQGLFIKSNPLTIPGLSPWQRLGHLDGILHWFSCIPRVFFLLVPLICIFGQLNPVLGTPSEFVYIFLPFYLMQLTMFSWLSKRARSILLSDVYTLIQTIPVFVTVIKVMFVPFGKGFNVTPKGLSRNKFNYNWSLALPMSTLFVATVVSFSLSILSTSQNGFNIGLYWSSYNLLTISVAMVALLDIPKPSFYEWFDRKKEINIYSTNNSYGSITQKISEEGVEIVLDKSTKLETEVFVELLPETLIIPGKVTRSRIQDNSLIATVKFQNVTIEQHRELIQMLYCTPGQWQTKNTPNELQSLLILTKLILRPLMFFNSKKVSQLKLQY